MRRTLALALLLSLPVHAQESTEKVSEVTRPEADRAVKRALDYLKTAQRPSGAWALGDGREATSITSLAVMAYLACGHSPGLPGPYRETIERGLRYVIDHQQANGLLATNTVNGPMYCHGISSLMLAECVGMTPDEALSDEIQEALARALEVILRAQAVQKDSRNAGGWRYQPDSRDSDLSVSGWQAMALRAARGAGCNVPGEAIDQAVSYVKQCAHLDGGFGYQPGGGPNNPRTGTGILTLEICGEHQSPEALAGAEYLNRPERAPRWSSPYFFYEVYYVPQALFQLGDEYFRPYYSKLVELLLQHQEPDGSWLSSDGNDRAGGRVYCTAMAVLALAIESRYLPIYQR